MKYKPDEKTLISYLYGELDQQEQEKVKAYLERNPEVKHEMEQMRYVRRMLGKLEDREVTAPLFIQPNPVRSGGFLGSAFFRYAAGIVLLLGFTVLLGKYSGVRLSVSGSEIKIGFWEKNTVTVPVKEMDSGNLPDQSELKEIIRSSLTQYQDQLDQQWSLRQQNLEKLLEDGLKEHGERMDQVMKETSQDTEKRIFGHLDTIKQQNITLMDIYWQEVSMVQKEYMDALLKDFALQVQWMREEDLAYLQDRLNGIENEKDQFQLEMEKILAGLISQVGNIEHQ